MLVQIGKEIFDADRRPPPRKYGSVHEAIDAAFLGLTLDAAGKTSVSLSHGRGFTAQQIKEHRAEAVAQARELRKRAEPEAAKLFEAQEKKIADLRIAGPFLTHRKATEKLRELSGLDKKAAAMDEAVATLGGAPSAKDADGARRKAADDWQKKNPAAKAAAEAIAKKAAEAQAKAVADPNRGASR